MFDVFAFTMDETAGYGEGLMLVAAETAAEALHVADHPEEFEWHGDENRERERFSSLWQFSGKTMMEAPEKGFITARHHVE